MMKTQNKIFYTVLFLFIGLLFLATPTKNASAIMDFGIPEEDGGGGTVGNPVPPPQPPSTITLTVDLNKTTYNIGETMVVSGSVVRNACGNNYVDIKITGQVVGVGSPVTMEDSILNGGVPLSFSSNFTAPSTTGSKIFRVVATTYSPAYYYVELSDGSGYWSSFTLSELEQAIPDGYFYHAGTTSFINSITEESFLVHYVATGTDVLASAPFEIPFTVVAPATVDVQVNGVQGPITVNGGSGIEVTWVTNPSATSCTCTCRNPDTNVAINCGSGTTTSCGTGTATPYQTSTPPSIPNVTKPTKFDVHCEP